MMDGCLMWWWDDHNNFTLTEIMMIISNTVSQMSFLANFVFYKSDFNTGFI